MISYMVTPLAFLATSKYKKIQKMVKIAKTEEENLYIFWMTISISKKFSEKM